MTRMDKIRMLGYCRVLRGGKRGDSSKKVMEIRVEGKSVGR